MDPWVRQEWHQISGFRPWEGIFPTAFEIDETPAIGCLGRTRVIAYGLEASRMPNIYRPLWNTLISTKSWVRTPIPVPPSTRATAFLFERSACLNRLDLLRQDAGAGVVIALVTKSEQPSRGPTDQALQRRLSDVRLKKGDVLFYLPSTRWSCERIFVGGFKQLQFIVNQRDNPLGSDKLLAASMK